MIKTVAATGALLLLASCGKNESPNPPQVVGYDVYITGYYDTDQTEKIACYWLNGERMDVTDGTKDAEITSVTASGGSVYFAGMEDYKPFYMKDGTRVDLEQRHHSTYDIDVVNGSVYVLGNGFYWKGSDRTVSMPDTEKFPAYALAVSDGTVYVVGTDIRVGSKPCYWTGNGIEWLTIPVQRAWANCAAASGGSVYIGGYYMDNNNLSKPCYWKDGVFKLLAFPDDMNFVEVKGIAVENGKVYVTGYYFTDGGYKGCYWADGKRMPLEIPEDGSVDIAGIAAGGGKVYVAGHLIVGNEDFVCCWIDGKRHEFETEPDMRNISVSDIALMEKVI